MFLYQYSRSPSRQQGVDRFLTAIVFVAVFGAWHVSAAAQNSNSSTISLLVLKSGRAVSGNISQSAGGYVVEKSNGRMLVPFDDVRVHASNLAEAYTKLQRTDRFPTASSHLELAKWCFNHQLFNETRAELREALKLEPNRREARRMLVRVDAVLNPKRINRSTSTARPAQTADGFKQAKAESLAGLSRDSAQQFVSKIQPLLLRKCATARCHTPNAANHFQLKRIHPGRGSHRASSEQNLATVFRFVDFDKPDQSPLLVIPLANHGNGRETIFHGLGGTKQLTALRQWVEQVAFEHNRVKRSNQVASPFKFSKKSTRVEQVSAISTEFPQRRVTNKIETFETARTTRRGKDEDLLQAILREEQKDAFDPNVFNRRVHGTNGRQPVSATPAAN